MTFFRTRVVSGLIVLALAPAVFYSLQATLAASAASAPPESLYISSPKVLKRLSLGYNGLLADVYWTRVVQYFGWHHHFDHSYALVKPLLEITNELDPHLLVVYEVGSTFLAQKPPEGAGDPDAAVQLVERGIRENPNVWRLYYHLGFIQYLERKDYTAAAKAFDEGSRVPGAHPWMHIMAAMMQHHAGDMETEKYLWQNIYESTEDPSIKESAAKHLLSLQVDTQVNRLQNMVSEYRRRTGRNPNGFQDMMSIGMIPGTPMDPLKRPYKMTDGKVEVQDSSRFPFLHQAPQ